MIHVVATITVREGCLEDFLAIFKANVAPVLVEDGCRGYSPTVDLPAGIPVQVAHRESVVTIIEAWESLNALRIHLAAPHMLAYKEATKGLVAGVSLQILQPA